MCSSPIWEPMSHFTQYFPAFCSNSWEYWKTFEINTYLSIYLSIYIYISSQLTTHLFSRTACNVSFDKWKPLERTHLYPEASNFIKNDTLAQVFSCEFYEFFTNTFFTEQHTSRRLLLSLSIPSENIIKPPIFRLCRKRPIAWKRLSTYDCFVEFYRK